MQSGGEIKVTAFSVTLKQLATKLTMRINAIQCSRRQVDQLAGWRIRLFADQSAGWRTKCMLVVSMGNRDYFRKDTGTIILVFNRETYLHPVIGLYSDALHGALFF